MDSEKLVLFFIAGILMVGGGMLVSHLFAPKLKNSQKTEPYECGVPTHGASWLQFKVGYYLFAILFLIFEVEMVFIFPWAVTVRDNALTAVIEITIFLIVLGIGLLYAWKKGALKWD